MRFVAVGDVMVDVAVAGDEWKHAAGAVRVRPGGSAANAAVWAAYERADATVVGRVGDDHSATMVRAALEERGVAARLAVDPELPTGSVVTVGTGPNRRVVADRGANRALAPDDLIDPLEADAVLVSGYVLLPADSAPAAEAALARARAEWVAVDAASVRMLADYGKERFFATTERANVLFANEEEAEALTDKAPEQAARELGRRYRLACVKRGADGVVASLDGRIHTAAVPGVAAADPSGAGDAFAAVLLVALARGTSAEAALARACEAGAQAAALPHAWPAMSN